MDIIDNFKTKKKINYSHEELKYIDEYCLKFYPSVDFDEAGDPFLCGTRTPQHFTDRYDYGKLNCNIPILKYEQDKEIQDYIKIFNLDMEKFYYFLLFISDFCFDTTVNFLSRNKSALEEVADFTAAYKNDESTTLTLKVGRKSYPITNQTIISSIVEHLQNKMDDWKNIQALTSQKINLNIYTSTSNSVTIAYFAKSIWQFFDMQPQIVSLRREGATSSEKELLFISKLIYFIGFSKTESYLASTELIRALLKQYKDYDFPIFSAYYLG